MSSTIAVRVLAEAISLANVRALRNAAKIPIAMC